MEPTNKTPIEMLRESIIDAIDNTWVRDSEVAALLCEIAGHYSQQPTQSKNDIDNAKGTK